MGLYLCAFITRSLLGNWHCEIDSISPIADLLLTVWLSHSQDLVMAPYAEEGCKLFVYGVNEGTSNSELQAEFEKFGTVTDTYNTGKGYAFVTFDNKDDAAEASDKLNGECSEIQNDLLMFVF